MLHKHAVTIRHSVFRLSLMVIFLGSTCSGVMAQTNTTSALTTRLDSLEGVLHNMRRDDITRSHIQTNLNIGAGFTSPLDMHFLDATFKQVNLILPSINVLADFKYSATASVGIGVNYVLPTHWTNVGVVYTYPTKGTGYSERFNLSVRALHYLNKLKSKWDIYCGIRVGASLWNNVGNANAYYGTSDPFKNQDIFIQPSLQVLMGIRYYATATMGIHIELGVGSPYAAEAGLSFKLQHHNKKSI